MITLGLGIKTGGMIGDTGVVRASVFRSEPIVVFGTASSEWASWEAAVNNSISTSVRFITATTHSALSLPFGSHVVLAMTDVLKWHFRNQGAIDTAGFKGSFYGGATDTFCSPSGSSWDSDLTSNNSVHIRTKPTRKVKINNGSDRSL